MSHPSATPGSAEDVKGPAYTETEYVKEEAQGTREFVPNPELEKR